VCRWPYGDAITCGQCGWELLGGYIAGPASPDDERRLADLLAAERRRHDLLAAARAAGSGTHRDLELLALLATLARGAPPTPDQIGAAVAEIDSREPPLAATTVGVGFTLTRLVAGEIDGIAFIEIGPDAVSVETLVVDDLGEPVRGARAEPLEWSWVLPMLPDDTSLRRLRLAGGIGIAGKGGREDQPGPPADPAVLAAAVVDSMPQMIGRLMTEVAAALRRHPRWAGGSGSSSRASPRLDTVLVRRTRGWPVLELITERARVAMRPVAEIASLQTGPLANVVDDIARRAPLRYSYDLVLVKVDPRSGTIHADPHPLFPAGTAVHRHDRQTASAAVIAPAHAASTLALPVVARRGTDLARWPLVHMAAMDGRTTVPTQLRIVLSGPGHVTVSGIPGLLSGSVKVPAWPGAWIGAPRRLPREVSLDLVLLVELGGAAATVASRVRLARGVAEGLAAGVDARMAVVGYRDHSGRHRIDAPVHHRDALLVGCGMGGATALRSAFAKPAWWRAVKVNDDQAAPLEDALHLLGQPRWVWRPGARHVLLVFGSRPPHPPKMDREGSVTQPCPHRFGWHETLDRLRREQAVECLAVLDEPRAGTQPSHYAEHAWKQFGAQGSFTARSTTAEHLAQVVGISSGGGTARLCLAARAGVASPGRGREEGGR
jgi:hypothetical protein